MFRLRPTTKAVDIVTDVSAHRDPEGRYADDRGHEKVGVVPGAKAPKATREYTAKHLDSMLDKFLKTMQTTATRLQEKLLKPEVRQKGKEQVKGKSTGFGAATAEPLAGGTDPTEAVRTACHRKNRKIVFNNSTR